MTKEEYREWVAEGFRIMGYTRHYLFVYGMCLAFCEELKEVAGAIASLRSLKIKQKLCVSLLRRSWLKEMVL